MLKVAVVAVVTVVAGGERAAFSCIILPCIVLHSVTYKGSISTLYTSKMKPANIGGTTANFRIPSLFLLFLVYIPGTYRSWLFALFFYFTENSPESREQCAASAGSAYQPSPPYSLASYQLIELRNPRRTSEYTLIANDVYPSKPKLEIGTGHQVIH